MNIKKPAFISGVISVFILIIFSIFVLSPQFQVKGIGASLFKKRSLKAATTLLQPHSNRKLVSIAEQMIAELGCGNCHTDLQIPSQIQSQIPNLSFAGLRYNPAYLFDFLQNPVKVRRHIGRARMPNFYFDEKEALALTLYLESKQAVPNKLSDLPKGLDTAESINGSTKQMNFAAIIRDDWLCLTCHKLKGEGGDFAADLASVSYRLKPEWVKQFLADPALFDVPQTVMPPQFFQQVENENYYEEMMPDAAQKIQAFTEYLFSLEKEKKQQLDDKFAAAKTAHPQIDAAVGEKIYRSQNCYACHRDREMENSSLPLAPPLNDEGSRVKKEWLLEFLKRPQAIRPFGAQPGSGSRMPDFKLTNEEAAAISAFLFQKKGKLVTSSQAFQPEKLSAFSAKKAGLLLTEKLSCLGCHQLNGSGGKIGPDLSAAGSRLQPSYIYHVIENPRRVTPHSVMPKISMTTKTTRLIANFIAQQKSPSKKSTYLSLAENSITLLDNNAEVGDESTPAKITYAKYCAACHGNSGGGDGFNAPFLPAVPTIHSDKTYMAKRPDDTLFDGIYAGGYMLNKHQFMPPWGQTLSRSQIEKLVGYMRTLCQCQGPGWSLDNH